MNYSLKTIVDEKFWIIESDGQKCGTLRQTTNGQYEINYRNGNVTVADKVKLREDFGIDIETNIFKQDIKQPVVEVTRNTDERHVGEVHGYPSACVPYNVYVFINPFYRSVVTFFEYACVASTCEILVI